MTTQPSPAVPLSIRTSEIAETEFKHRLQLKQLAGLISLCCGSAKRIFVIDYSRSIDHQNKGKGDADDRFPPVPSAQCPVPSAQCECLGTASIVGVEIAEGALSII